jgi:hypothetical protein
VEDSFYNFYPATIKPMAQVTSVLSMTECLAKRLVGTKGKHFLWVDLMEFKFGQGEVVHYSADVDVNSPNWNRLEEVLKMMDNLKQFVEADARKPPSECIDSVQWNVDYEDEPTEEMWEILNGLSPPKHLKLVAGFFEDCDVEPLKAFQHQWNDLETLCLDSISNYDFMENPPSVFSRISSLTLDHCSGLDFLPPAATRLRHLRILENNACDMFIHAVNHNPHFAQVLEVLEIASTNSCDFPHYKPQDFRDCIQKCANLREFRVAAGYRDSLDTDLASYIPPPVEKLALRFTRSLPFLHDIDDWINYGSDKTWLPRLKSFQLTIDPESCVGGLEGEVVRPWPREWMRKLENPPQEFTPEAFDVEFEERRTALYDVLKSTRPSIDLFF